MGQRLFPGYSRRKPDRVMVKSKNLSANSLTWRSCFHPSFHSLCFTAVLTLASSPCPFFSGQNGDFQNSVISSVYFCKTFPPLSLLSFISSFCRSSLSLTIQEFTICWEDRWFFFFCTLSPHSLFLIHSHCHISWRDYRSHTNIWLICFLTKWNLRLTLMSSPKRLQINLSLTWSC